MVASCHATGHPHALIAPSTIPISDPSPHVSNYVHPAALPAPTAPRHSRGNPNKAMSTSEKYNWPELGTFQNRLIVRRGRLSWPRNKTWPPLILLLDQIPFSSPHPPLFSSPRPCGATTTTTSYDSLQLLNPFFRYLNFLPTPGATPFFAPAPHSSDASNAYDANFISLSFEFARIEKRMMYFTNPTTAMAIVAMAVSQFAPIMVAAAPVARSQADDLSSGQRAQKLNRQFQTVTVQDSCTGTSSGIASREG